MRFDGRLVAIVAMSCVCVVPPRRVAADEWSKRTVVTFNEPSTGAPYAITTWFYPGRTEGEEFIYSIGCRRRPARSDPSDPLRFSVRFSVGSP